MTSLKPAEAEDPLELISVAVPVPEGYDALGEMARCFVEEFALMGWNAERILSMFKNPFFQGPYGICQARGEEFVQNLIRQVFEGVRTDA